MILILSGVLRLEFLYFRLLSANCGERSVWPMVGAGKAGEFEEKTAGFQQKAGRKSEYCCPVKYVLSLMLLACVATSKVTKEAENLQEGFCLTFLPRKTFTFTGQQ